MKLKDIMKRWFFQHRALALNAAAIDARAELLNILGLAADATDEAIAAELQKLKAEAEADKTEDAAATAAEMEKMKGDVIAANAKVAAADALATTAKALAVNSALTLAITTGRITGAQRGDWETKLNADLAAVTELEKLTPAFNTSPLNIQQGGALAVPATPRERMLAWNSAVLAKSRELKCSDADAEAAVKADPIPEGLAR